MRRHLFKEGVSSVRVSQAVCLLLFIRHVNCAFYLGEKDKEVSQGNNNLQLL